ncbi:UNVERIFIED_CONTAM: hypothetical protein GTU68_007820 [Idotea baltica]|nr:hypothetical protein [Idotea baltica]
MGRKPIEVVAAVIRDANGNILIAQRAQNKHEGGKWEFPGGKVEPGESRRAALGRELYEELGIEVNHSARLISVYHEYVEKSVYLDVYEVTQWDGTPSGREGQPIEWVSPAALKSFEFPAANKPIVDAVQLPKFIQVLKPIVTAESFERQVLSSLDSSDHFLFHDFAQTELTHEQLAWLLDTAASRDVSVIIQSPPPLIRGDYHLHLTAEELVRAQVKPEAVRVSATCHTPGELFKAQSLGLDFVFIGPVLMNPWTTDVKPMGWPLFQSYAGRVNVPVYAIGGLSAKDLELAREYGAQGIASTNIII